MFAGHFGLAAAVKAKTPEVPLWALMLSTQLLDVIFVPLFVSGIETIEGSGYGQGIIHADYTHSLLGALLIALFGGLVAWRAWGRKGGLVIGSVIFSHWILDLLMHHADMPLLPGNLGDLPVLGFGLWKYMTLSIIMEMLLIVVGAIMYYRSIVPKTRDKHRRFAIGTASLMGVLLVLALLSDVLGIG
jgi:membrane-bound metal-dependent hydrolase YbcI (DUF457 family)